jgi:hypothetical protein
MLKYTDQYVGLKHLDVYIKTDNEEYFSIVGLDETLSCGKSSFLIDINPGLFVVKSKIKIEITNSKNEIIYSEIPMFLENNRRRVSIWFYPEDNYGEYDISIVGELKNVPKSWKGVYNVRWSKNIHFQAELANTQLIRFYQVPEIVIEENRRPYLTRGFLTNPTGSLEGNNLSGYVDNKGDYYINVNNSSLTSEMNGSSLVINSSDWTPKIVEVINSNLAKVDCPYTTIIQNKPILSPFQGFTFTASYDCEPTYSESENYQSFAKIEINEMSTFSGEVKRIKTFLKSRGDSNLSDYLLVNDSLVGSKEFLIDSSSFEEAKRIGEFKTLDTLDDNWTAEGSIYDIKLSNSRYIDALKIYCNKPYTTDIIYQRLTNTVPIPLSEESNYQLTFNLLSQTWPVEDEDDQLLLNVYISGSAFAQTELVWTTDTLLKNKRFDKVEIDISPNHNGEAYFVFEIKKGTHYISDISLVDNNTFTPNHYLYQTQIPTWARNDDLDFKIEFYDIDGNKAPEIIYKDNINFDGSNIFIEGNDNLLTGSLYLSNTIGQGIEQSGQNSGFIRSIGYNGFESASNGEGSGFMMWTGSVLPDITDEYSGVGLELYGDSESYFRYRTTDNNGDSNPNLDIRAKEFYVGTESSYLQGSGSFIEIKADNLLISNDATMSAIENTDAGLQNKGFEVWGVTWPTHWYAVTSSNIQVSKTPTGFKSVYEGIKLFSLYVTGSSGINGTFEFSQSVSDNFTANSTFEGSIYAREHTPQISYTDTYLKLKYYNGSTWDYFGETTSCSFIENSYIRERVVGKLPENAEEVILIISGAVCYGDEYSGEGTASINFDTTNLSYMDPFTEIVPEGLLIAYSEDKYLKITSDDFELKGSDITAESIQAQSICSQGNICASGSVNGWMKSYTYHNFNISSGSTGERFIPINFVSDSSTVAYYTRWTAPHNGIIKGFWLEADTDDDAGNTVMVRVYNDLNIGDSGGGHLGHKQANYTAAVSDYYEWPTSIEIISGEPICISVAQPGAIGQNFNMTIVYEYDTNN